LEQAIRFLHPLQTLAARRIETHLMAFEIYSRKSKIRSYSHVSSRLYKYHKVSYVFECELDVQKASLILWHIDPLLGNDHEASN
jgi:hypothetical protein